jgi:hypothetical protein
MKKRNYKWSAAQRAKYLQTMRIKKQITKPQRFPRLDESDVVVAKPIESFFDRLWNGLSTNDKGYALCSLIDREMKKL